MAGLKGDPGDKGEAGTITVVTPITGPEVVVNLPTGSLAKSVPVAQFTLPSGQYSLMVTVDLTATLPIGQQFTCQMATLPGLTPIDNTPIVYAAGRTRLVLMGTATYNAPFSILVSCGSDVAASVLHTQVLATQVEHVNPTLTATLP
jgi:hypothetical protein